jgi:hypothetical protein
MSDELTFEAYLNQKKRDRETILMAAQSIAKLLGGFPSADKIGQELKVNLRDEPGLINDVNSLDRDGDFLERTALTMLSLAWENKRHSIEQAFEEAEAALISKEGTLLGLTALIVFGLWTWTSNGGETFHYQKTVRNSDGSFTTEEHTERQPFPLDVPGIIRALKGQDDPNFRPNKDQIEKAQKALVAAGYHIATDGREGAHTDKAVSEYQRAKNLQITGRLDQATLRQLGVAV